VLTRENSHGAAIRKAGIALVPIPFRRRGMNPVAEARCLWAIFRAYRGGRPDLVHQIALKPILYGSLAARLARVRRVVNAPVGMGFAFASKRLAARVLRPAIGLAFKLLMNPRGSRVVFENGDDRAALVANGTVREADAVLIRGAGVDIAALRPAPPPPGPPVVVLASRMLYDKGVGEYVAAARMLRGEGVDARFLLVGAPDGENPAAIPEAQLRAWQEAGAVEWLGHRTDMAAILRGAHIACLPSYREGLPKSLLEAMAAGLPIVTTDVPGCREAVRDGENGLLVPARAVPELAEALRRLIRDPQLRARMGAAGRARAETEFASARVVAETLALYAELTGRS